jgi:hypothetical protein
MMKAKGNAAQNEMLIKAELDILKLKDDLGCCGMSVAESLVRHRVLAVGSPSEDAD